MKDTEVTITMDELELGHPQREGQTHGLFPHNTPAVVPSEYHKQHVAPKLDHRPWLDILDSFLDPNYNDSFSVSPTHRLTHFDVDVVHISTNGTVHPHIKCVDAAEFQAAIASTGDKHGATIVLAEDISAATIDALGMQYSLEPEFFASHLHGTELFRTGNFQAPGPGLPARGPNLLPDYLRWAPFYSAEFRRSYSIPEGFKEAVRLRSTVTNTPRGVQMLREELRELFICEKISVYQREGANFGVILTDKLLHGDPTSSYMLDTVSSLPNSPSPPSRRRQVSARTELLTWLRDLPQHIAVSLLSPASPPLAIHPVLRLVERFAVTFLVHARFITRRIVAHHTDANFPDSIPFYMRILRALYRHIHDQHRMLRFSRRLSSFRGGFGHAELEQDLQFWADEMKNVLKEVKEDVRFLVAAASIREGKIVGLVSKFAFLFLPVSLLASVIALMDPGYVRWAILGGLSVPFLLFSAYGIFLWSPSDIDSFRSYTR